MWWLPECRPSRAARVRACGLCVVLVLGAALRPAVAQEGDFESLRMDEVVDVPTVLLAAERGDPRAAFLLGTRYAAGRGGVRDDSEARRWFRVAAEGGLAEAQYNLALLLAGGRGGQRDAAEALRWYEQAGEQGLVPAQFNAGMLLLDGNDGVAADEQRAAAWLRRAAESGLAPAEFNVGVLREFGRGMPRDPAAAEAWYRRAARQGYPPARERLAALSGASSQLPDSAVAMQGQAAQTPGASAPPPGIIGAVNEWPLARDPARFTLQLFSRRDEPSVREYLREHAIDEEGGYFRSRNDGTDWYSVVHGDYASHAEATAAAARLPKSLGIAEPWVRNFGAIHRNIRR